MPITDIILSDVRKVGIQNFRFTTYVIPHNDRHGCSYHQRELGHKNLTITSRYSHLALSYKVKTVRTLEERLGTEDKNTSVLHNFRVR